MALSQNSIPKKQRVLLPILIWLVPLLAVNLGFYFLSGIDRHWLEIEQKDMANQEIEALSSASDFSYQFSKAGGEFRKAFKSALGADFTAKQLKSFLLQRAKKIYRKPFPEKDLLAFQIPEKKNRCEMILSDGGKILSRRAFSRVFKFLVNLNQGKSLSDVEKKQNEKLLGSLLGPESKSHVMAVSQRAKTTYALYKSMPNWFLWDFFTIPGKGTFGYMILSPCLDQNRFDGMLLSLREFRDQRLGLAAFIPLFKGYGGNVFQSPLQKSKLFRSWANKTVTPVEADLQKWLASGTPAIARLGNFNVFSYLGKGNTHLTTMLLPALKDALMPSWLFWLNHIVGALIALLLLRGFLLGQWPQINLKYKFLMTFLLAATLPLSILVIASSGYISQFRRSTHFQTISKLLMCIKQFDARKAQVADEYRAAFVQLVKKPEFTAALNKEDSFSKEAAKLIEGTFRNKDRHLPFLCYALLDEVGEGIRGYETGKKEDVDPFIDSFSYPIVGWLRNLRKKDPKLREYFARDDDKIAVEAYNSVTSRDLLKEVGDRRSYPIIRRRGAVISTQMHEFIKVDGLEKYAVLIAWDDSALDEQTIRQTSDFLALNNSEFNFIQFKNTPQGLEEIQKLGRHVPIDILSESKKLAETASFRGSSASLRTDKYSIVAYPAKKYGETIIVGIASNFALENSTFYRISALGLILFVAVFIVFICAYFAARMILTPITNLKGSLDQVASGNLNAEIVAAGKDELGRLSSEFSEMARGLRERDRLASLLSDHAIEALSKSQATDGSLAGESFYGVALVSDIRNFTGMCEEFSPDKVTELLNEHFARMSAVISERGGRIYKYIGDAIEAVFPEDPTLEDSPELRAFQAASQMNIELIKINSDRANLGLYQYKTGVGLAYGLFFSGGVGSMDTRLDYAVLGDPLKRAANLEALSIKNPAFPVIVDAKVADCVSKSGIKFAELELGEDAFQICEIINSEILQDSVLPEGKVAESEEETFAAHPGSVRQSELPAWLIFTICFSLIAVFLIGIFAGLDFRKNSRIENDSIELSESNLRLMEQLKCDNVGRVGYETACSKAQKNIAAGLSFVSKGNEQLIVAERTQNEMAKLDEKGLELSRVLAFCFADENDPSSTKDFVQTAFNKGWKDDQVNVLRLFAHYKHHFDLHIDRPGMRARLDNEIPALLGETNTMSVFYAEKFGAATEVNIGGSSEVIFSRYLIAYSDEMYKFDFSKDPSLLRQKGRDDLFRIVGMVFFSIPLEKLSLPLVIANCYSRENIDIAILDEDNQLTNSANFPDQLKAQLAFSKLNKSFPHGVLTQDYVTIGEKKLQISIYAHLVNQLAFLERFAGPLFIAFALFAAWFIYATLKEKSFVNRSMTAKLWLVFLICSIVPIVTVFFVVDLFSTENLNAKVFQEKADLQRFLDLFELRQSFSEPLAWKNIKKWSFSRKLKTAVTNTDNQPESQKDFTELDKLFASWHHEMEILRMTVTNFYLRDVAIVSKKGWEYINAGAPLAKFDQDVKSEENAEPNSQFGTLLVKVAKNLILRMRNEESLEGFDGESLKGEIALKIGLQTVRAMFGEDVSVKMANGVGLPVKMSILDSMVGVIIHPVDQMKMPDYVIISMSLFFNDRYLDKIASMYKGDYAVFPIESTRGTMLSNPMNCLFDLGVSEINSWISSSNLPLSGQKTLGNHRFLYEARRGIQQFSMIITGMKPVNPILRAVSETDSEFLKALLLSLILIVLLAKNISAEIIAPVEQLAYGMKEIGSENFSYRIPVMRSDELGDLCNSFNKMSRGLEEKFMMGKMLSQNAMDSTLRETGSCKEEVVVIYVGSPGFSSWLSLSSPSDLFSDLQKQISEISRIILAEGGDIDKIIGDKVLAVFRGDSRQATVAACKVAQKIMNAEQRGILPFPAAAGINMGPVISGILGVGNKKDFTIIGDAVNVTARIESLAETMRYQRMLISESIFRSINSEITAREYGTVELKGKAEPMKVYQLDL